MLRDTLATLDMGDKESGTTLTEIQWRLAAMGVEYPAKLQALAAELMAAGWTRQIDRKGRRWYQPGVKALRNTRDMQMEIIAWILKTVKERGSMPMPDLQKLMPGVFDIDIEETSRPIMHLVYAGRLNAPKQAGVRMLSLVAAKAEPVI